MRKLHLASKSRAAIYTNQSDVLAFPKGFNLGAKAGGGNECAFRLEKSTAGSEIE
jgi:hypothetical protein